MKAIAVIPMRSGSTSITRKNIKLMDGWPLFTYVYYACRDSGVFEQVWISTDSEEFAKLGRLYGAKVWLRQDPSVSTNTASSADMMAEFITGVRETRSDCAEYDVIYCVHATSPLSKPIHFAESWELFQKEDADAMITTFKTHQFFWENTGSAKTKELNSVPFGNRERRQDWEGDLIESGDFYVAKTEFFERRDWRGGNIIQYRMPLIHQYDIDEPSDWDIMEKLVRDHAHHPEKRIPDIDYVLEHHSMARYLVELNIINPQNVELYYGAVRDDDTISVLRDTESGVIFLGDVQHYDECTMYEENDEFQYWGAGDRQKAIDACFHDDNRRFNQTRHMIEGKAWLDVGTGVGGLPELYKGVAGSICLAELQASSRRNLQELGFEVFRDISGIDTDERFDVISYFHVFEHIYDIKGVLEDTLRLLKPGGTLIIEVPHARDSLLLDYDLDPFKKFTFWSEHLVLHTKDSLKIIMENFGFQTISIDGYQRYPLHNHLHWLRHSRPSGFYRWEHMTNPVMEEEYVKVLQEKDRTDTIFGIFQKPV